MASDTAIPKVTETDIDREDLVEAAKELDIEDYESLGDQELFEEVGRELGEIDDDGAEESDDGSSTEDDQPGEEALEQIRSELGGMTRNELRDELRDLGLSVSGNKAELLERLEAVRVGQATAASNGQAAAETAAEDAADEASETAGKAAEQGDEAAEDVQETAEDAAEEGEDAAEQAQQTAEDTADEAAEQGEDATEQAQDTAEDTADEAAKKGEDAAEQAQDTAEDTADKAAKKGEDAAEQAQDTADEVTEDRKQARDRGEYRVEDDEREQIQPVLDLELGPLALDVLGLDVHLNRVHLSLVANPEPKHAVLGKTLRTVGTATDKLGVNKLLGKVTQGVEKLAGVLPTPDTGGEDDSGDGGGEEDEDGGGEGILSRAGSAATGAAKSAVNVFRHGSDAAGNAKDATKDAVTSGGKMSAAGEAKDAWQDTKKAAKSAKNAASGGE